MIKTKEIINYIHYIQFNQTIQHKQKIENTTGDLEDYCGSTSIKN